MDSRGDRDRIPLAQVVSELVKGWFQDAMKEARAGDTNMQVLVGQMYCTGFGVPKDVQKMLEKGLMVVLELVKLQGSVLQFGKLVISIQVMMQVTQTLKN
ncbi:hypothetical protein QQP08_012235 [Theobroma cacao]|nr:hypothetical protein QQP08_012235 [Theobroma cacao]